MDALTEGIIATLRRDGRASFSAMARDLGTNREIVAGRVNTLIADGRLRIVAGIHPYAAGLPVTAHLSLRVSGSTAPVIEALTGMDSLRFIAETTGTHQIGAETRLPGAGALQSQLMALRAIPEVLDVEVHLYEQIIESFFGGRALADDRPALDGIDLAIMTALQRDGRATYAEIAAAAGLSISACRTRTVRLLDSGVLKIGAVHQRADMTSEFLFGIGVNARYECREAQNELRGDPGLEFLARCLGRFDMIATVGFGSLRRYNALVDRLRALPSVLHVETWLHVRIAREAYDHDLGTIPVHPARPGPDLHVECVGQPE
ncbi:Lrp/AsnC family transcriptional regulator [Actinoplanes couchii]|uniref:AsnC family transcriptional regulator n=1 Tax=Actinoplanes couchii TaxID=403638 RepID=A0ABQ3XGU4_9ACTN|nr:Lrp/AsnC family transcriptional regulator [Actinoplanes couchii]MDR6320807.1 DNA-binding Lrp family transcriptional regulator [Actinoplanes couchii]GID57708.1 AsnC family transcriptional regulator [Actinoplanes couchii]